jgi:hypothetical protein
VGSWGRVTQDLRQQGTFGTWTVRRFAVSRERLASFVGYSNIIIQKVIRFAKSQFKMIRFMSNQL